MLVQTLGLENGGSREEEGSVVAILSRFGGFQPQGWRGLLSSECEECPSIRGLGPAAMLVACAAQFCVRRNQSSTSQQHCRGILLEIHYLPYLLVTV